MTKHDFSSSSSNQWSHDVLENFSRPSGSYSSSSKSSKSSSRQQQQCGRDEKKRHATKCQDQEICLPPFEVCLDGFHVANKPIKYRQPSVCVQPKPVEVCHKPFWVKVQPKAFWVKVQPKPIRACSKPETVHFDEVCLPVPDTYVKPRKIKVKPPTADLRLEYEQRPCDCVKPICH